MPPQHQEALDKIFQEHKETKERQIQSHIQAETDNLKREINKTVSARQLEYRRLLSDRPKRSSSSCFTMWRSVLHSFAPHRNIWNISPSGSRKPATLPEKMPLWFILIPQTRTGSRNLPHASALPPVVSREAFMGGMRAVIRSKNILIDNSFATLLREAKEEFVFAGGMTDE